MNNRRRGKTLVELMVIVSIMSVVLAASTTTLAALFQLDRQFRRDAELATTLGRLGARFRGDVHQAAGIQAAESCILSLPDGRAVHYAVAQRSITREIRRGEAVEHRDSFGFPAAVAVSFGKVDLAGGTIVRLTIRPASPPAKGSPTIAATTIDAALALPRQEVRP